MRASFLEPLGYCYLNVTGRTDLKLCRIAVVARAVDDRIFDSQDEDLVVGSELIKNYDFKSIFPSARLTGVSQLDMEVDLSGLIDTGNLRGSFVAAQPPIAFEEDYLTLRLSDR